MRWDSEISEIRMNPSYSSSNQNRFQTILEAASSLKGHIWLSTSGSTSPKWVGLSKQAILASAAAVNAHLQSTSADTWIQALPTFHVGGLAIDARCYLSGARLIDPQLNKWDPTAFKHLVEYSQGTLTALVPAQLHDIAAHSITAPGTLRAVVVGGGALSPELYFQAVCLGWKVLPSYGLTECASQVATAELDSWKNSLFPPLKVLSHMKVITDSNERLHFYGPSLLSAYAFFNEDKIEITDPKINGWFSSQDRGVTHDTHLQIWGRVDQVIKIGGENVDMARLDKILQDIGIHFGVHNDIVLLVQPHARLGHILHVAVANNVESVLTDAILEEFHKRVLPFEKIRHIHRVPFIPRSPLAKVLKSELFALINA